MALCGDREQAERLVEGAYAHALDEPGRRGEPSLPRLFAALLARWTQSPPRPASMSGLPLPFQAIATLPGHQRAVIVAVDVAGLTPEQGAGVLGHAPATVRRLLFEARDRVADALLEPGREDASVAGQARRPVEQPGAMGQRRCLSA